jgi:uncharacterized protein (DUF305 family)
MKTSRSFAVSILMVVALAGCGTAAETLGGSTTAQPESVTGQANAQNNAADVRFSLRMITHHRQTLELAALMQEKENVSDEIRTLAIKIASIHEPETAQLEGMLRAWGELDSTAQSQRLHASGGHQLPGMADDAEIDKLASLKGERSSRAFLELMIDHHRATIKVAEAEMADGSNAEAVALARTIAEIQRQELHRMRRMLDGYR